MRNWSQPLAGPVIRTGSKGRIRRILEIIESEAHLTISDLALEFHLSESRLQHLFKQATGVALGRALAENKLNKAAALLTNTHLTIKEIALTVGYVHTSSFTRAFARRFAQTPQLYRNAGERCEPGLTGHALD